MNSQPSHADPSRLALPATPWVAGHRGAAGDRPENTAAGALLAVDRGADLVELDVQRTLDGHLVLHHDPDLERTTGIPLEIEGEASDTLTTALAPHGGAIQRLEDVLAKLPDNFPLNLELKRWSAPRAPFAEGLLEAIDGRHNTLISSFDWDLLREVRRQAHSVPVGVLARDRWSRAFETANQLEAFSFHCRHDRLPEARRHGIDRGPWHLLAYTVNEVDLAERLFAEGVRGVFSDYPGRLKAGMDRDPDLPSG